MTECGQKVVVTEQPLPADDHVTNAENVQQSLVILLRVLLVFCMRDSIRGSVRMQV